MQMKFTIEDVDKVPKEGRRPREKTRGAKV